jgi:tubulin-specific chaperone E
LSGLSQSATAASLVRPSRRTDVPQSFISALHEKYGSDEVARGQTEAPKPAPTQIEISGKVVEEVGFDKIRQKLAQLQELRIVILDGMRIDDERIGSLSVKHECPKVTELDLSRNLFTKFTTVVDICSELEDLRTLRLK